MARLLVSVLVFIFNFFWSYILIIILFFFQDASQLTFTQVEYHKFKSANPQMVILYQIGSHNNIFGWLGSTSCSIVCSDHLSHHICNDCTA